MARKNLFAEISKVEDQEDGTVKVWGFASSGAVDSDGETITPDAMRAALPDYMKFANVREMHQPLAAGTAIEAAVQEDGRTWFGAHVIDPVAVKKVQAGVYKGFSIGGRILERDTLDRKIIKAIRLSEVSLVDRPANPEAVFTMVKMDDGSDGDDASAAEQATKTDEPVHLPSKATQEVANKSLYTVSRFAELLSGLGGVAADAEWEAQCESDSSPIPTALRSWLAQGASVFQAMAAEEATELLASLQAMVPAAIPAVEVIAQAAAPRDLEKAGAKFSTATKAALKAAHDACREADKALAALGYGDDEENDEDKDSDAAKAAALPTDDLLIKFAHAIGAQEGEDVIAAGAAIAKSLSDAKAEVGVLAKRVKELEAMPVPAKAAVNGVAITKAADVDDAAAPDSAVAALPAGAKGEVIAKAMLTDMFKRSA